MAKKLPQIKFDKHKKARATKNNKEVGKNSETRGKADSKKMAKCAEADSQGNSR